MKCAMSLKMKLTAYPFHFFVNAPPQKKKTTNTNQTKTTKKPPPLTTTPASLHSENSEFGTFPVTRSWLPLSTV